jgi:hypothetical protein
VQIASGNPLLKENAQASGSNRPRSTVVTHLTRQSREPRDYAPVAAAAQFRIARAAAGPVQHPPARCVRQVDNNPEGDHR